MSRFKRHCGAILVLVLLLSAFGGATLAEELPEMDLVELVASQEDASVIEEPPVAQAEAPADGEQPMAVEAPPMEAVPTDATPRPVTLNASELTLGVGESFALQPAAPEGADSVWFEYESSNQKVASVSEFGEVLARKKGSAIITVKVSDGTLLSCSVTVLKAPKSIKLNAKEVSLGYDLLTASVTTFQLVPTLSRKAGAIVRYASANPAVAEVSPSGLITPRGHGITTITASTFNNKSASCAVAVLAGPDTISFAETAPVLCEREVRPMSLSATQGTLAAARFASSNPAVASVNADTGELTALAYGETTVTAVSFNGKTASCAVTVVPGPDSISLPGETLMIGVGESASLGAVPVRADGQSTSPVLKYTSSKAKYVSVSEDGVLTGKKRGTAKITVTAPNGVTAVCTVKAVKAPTSIKLSIAKGALAYDAANGVAEQTVLSVKLSRNSGSFVTYSGYDPAVVSVAPNGRVTAVGLGSTTITATTYNGLTASCDVTVAAPGSDALKRKVVSVAHRGGAGYWPENTLEAFRNAASTGATAIELDVRTTKDGVQVVHHDAAITVDGRKYTLKKLTLARLRELKPGICTLDEALEVVEASGLELNLELKDTAKAQACVEAVRRYNLQGRTLYISFETKLLSQVRKLEPSARLGLCFESTPSSLARQISKLGLTHLFQRDSRLTLENLQAWQQDGLLVGVWTVDDAAAISSWLGMGVDYITSNYPKLVTEALAAR